MKSMYSTRFPAITATISPLRRPAASNARAVASLRDSRSLKVHLIFCHGTTSAVLSPYRCTCSFKTFPIVLFHNGRLVGPWMIDGFDVFDIFECNIRVCNFLHRIISQSSWLTLVVYDPVMLSVGILKLPGAFAAASPCERAPEWGRIGTVLPHSTSGAALAAMTARHTRSSDAAESMGCHTTVMADACF